MSHHPEVCSNMSFKVSHFNQPCIEIGNAQAGGSNEAVDLKKEEIEQLIVQLILDRVLVCVHCKYCQLIHKYILWSLISISHLTLIG